MKLATGGGGGGGRREARSGSRLSVSAPLPPPPRPPILRHSKSEGMSLGGAGGAQIDESSAEASLLTSRRLTLLGVGDCAAATRSSCYTGPTGAVSGGRTLKATRTRQPPPSPPQDATETPPTMRRTVHFDRCVRMVLVPARRDLDAATVHGVWWGAEDVAGFRVAAIKYFLEHEKMKTRSSAIGGGGGADGGDAASGEEADDQDAGAAKPPVNAPAPPRLPEAKVASLLAEATDSPSDLALS